MNPRRDDQTDIRWLAVRNDSGEEIPAYAAMMLTGELEDGIPLVAQPTADDIDPAFILINGPAAIPIDGDGAGTRDAPMIALAPGAVFTNSLGTQEGSWELGITRVGFLCWASVDSELALVVNSYRALVDVDCVDDEIVGSSPSLPMPPEADFVEGNDSVARGASIAFTDTSDFEPTSWHWEKNRDGSGWVDFDGTPTVQNPTEMFDTAGTYSIRLTVTNAIGQDTKTQTDLISVSPETPALVAATAASSGNTSSVTTGAIDTTGATLLYLSVPYFSGVAALVAGDISDSKGNTWLALTAAEGSSGNDDGDTIHFYVANPTVGSGHTVTISKGVSVYPGALFAAFSGVEKTSPVDQQNQHHEDGTGDTTRQPGSITPTTDGQLVLASVGAGVAGSSGTPLTGLSVNSSFTIATSTQGVSGTGFGGALAYLAQGAAAAVNPQFSATSPDFRSAVIVSFLPRSNP